MFDLGRDRGRRWFVGDCCRHIQDRLRFGGRRGLRVGRWLCVGVDLDAGSSGTRRFHRHSRNHDRGLRLSLAEPGRLPQ